MWAWGVSLIGGPTALWSWQPAEEKFWQSSATPPTPCTYTHTHLNTIFSTFNFISAILCFSNHSQPYSTIWMKVTISVLLFRARGAWLLVTSAVDFCQRFSVKVEFLRPSPHSLKGEISVSYLFIQKQWESSVTLDPVEAVDIAIPVQGSGELSRVDFDPIANVRSPITSRKQQQQIIEGHELANNPSLYWKQNSMKKKKLILWSSIKNSYQWLTVY